MPSSLGVSPSIPDLDADAILGQARSENFPVASFFLPRRVRSHLMAIYGFARLADDIGDEVEGDRPAQLDWLESELERANEGTATHPILVRLMPTLSELSLPLDPFRALIEANRVDQTVRRYETIEELADYCRLSAVPVGQLVLLVFGASTPARVALSDEVCIGLQLTEHLQDIGEDAIRGRIYLPARDRAAFGVTEDQLLAPRAGPSLQRLVAVHVNRARRRLAAGRPLSGGLPWQPRAAVAGFVGGGEAALDAIQRAGYDVLGTRCKPRPLGIVARLATTLFASPEQGGPDQTASADQAATSSRFPSSEGGAAA
ncbi:MAG TPA: squalene synthase HpnC [Acidimicrobiales bacterium]